MIGNIPKAFSSTPQIFKTLLICSNISLLLVGFSEMAPPFLWRRMYPSLANSSTHLLTRLPFLPIRLLIQLMSVLSGRYFAPQQCFLRRRYIRSAFISSSLTSCLDIGSLIIYLEVKYICLFIQLDFR